MYLNDNSFLYERYIRNIGSIGEKKIYIFYLFSRYLNYNKNIEEKIWLKALSGNIKSIKKIEEKIKSFDTKFNFSIDEFLEIINAEELYLKHQPNIHMASLEDLSKKGLDRLLFKYIDFFSFNFSDKKGLRDYKELSSGEKIIFSQFINLFIFIYRNRKNNYLIFLDEPDNRLHPKWQKEYINLLIKFLKANFKDKIFILF